MEENQNNEERQSQNQFVFKVDQTSESMPSPTTITAHKIKQETTTAASQPQIPTVEPQTDSMEVHKHPHHVMHKKKWNEYLLEFFMLFLAVFLGFIAENIRETSVERNREKEYMESLLGDLKNDISELHAKMQRFSTFPAALNQLANDCNSNTLSDSTQKRMYEANMRYLGTMQIYFTDKTATQLKNSGSMRLISHREVSDSITLYWQGMDDVRSTNANYENYRRALRQLSFKIFNYTFYQPYDNTIEAPVLFRNDRPQLTLKDPLLLKEYGSEVALISSNIKMYYLPALEKQRKMAVNLITLIRKKYRLKDE